MSSIVPLLRPSLAEPFVTKLMKYHSNNQLDAGGVSGLENVAWDATLESVRPKQQLNGRISQKKQQRNTSLNRLEE